MTACRCHGATTGAPRCLDCNTASTPLSSLSRPSGVNLARLHDGRWGNHGGHGRGGCICHGGWGCIGHGCWRCVGLRGVGGWGCIGGGSHRGSVGDWCCIGDRCCHGHLLDCLGACLHHLLVLSSELCLTLEPLLLELVGLHLHLLQGRLFVVVCHGNGSHLLASSLLRDGGLLQATQHGLRLLVDI